MKNYKLSVITASHNNLNGLKNLHSQLNGILSDDLEWVVKDSGLCINTKKFFSEISSPHITFTNSPDCGIYDAINAAIKTSTGTNYIVIGSDDNIDSVGMLQAVDLLTNLEEKSYDFITLSVKINDKVKHLKWYAPKFWSISSLISSHSVGTIIKKNIHDSVGFYDTNFKILGDCLLIKKSYLLNKIFLPMPTLIVGSFSTGGVSSKYTPRLIVEAFRYNLLTGSPIFIQILCVLVRLIIFTIKKLNK